MAASYARGFDAQTCADLCYEEFVRSNPYNDYTVPTVSMVGTPGSWNQRTASP